MKEPRSTMPWKLIFKVPDRMRNIFRLFSSSTCTRVSFPTLASFWHDAWLVFLLLVFLMENFCNNFDRFYKPFPVRNCVTVTDALQAKRTLWGRSLMYCKVWCVSFYMLILNQFPVHMQVAYCLKKKKSACRVPLALRAENITTSSVWTYSLFQTLLQQFKQCFVSSVARLIA